MKLRLIIILTAIFLFSCEERIFLDQTPDVKLIDGRYFIDDAGYTFDKAVLMGNGKVSEFYKCGGYDGNTEIFDIDESGDYGLFLVCEEDTVFSRTVYIGKYSSEVLKITVLDVRQGDCFIIDPPDNIPSVIDGGYGSYGVDEWQDGGNSTLKDHLSGLEEFDLNYIIETHHDADHYGGLYDLVNSGSFNFNSYLTYDSPEIPAFGDTLYFSADVKGVMLHYGDISGKAETDENDKSISIMLMYGDFEMIFTGDIEAAAEEAILSRNIIDTGKIFEILKVPHHGSSSSSTAEFLDVITPIISIISCGKNNPWGHPDNEIIDRLDESSIQILRTDLNGTVEIYSDGNSVQASFALK